MSTLYGYVRVSTQHQEGGIDAQRRALIEAGVDPANVFEDRITGTSSGRHRPGLAAALEACFATQGATLVVWRVDRLGRSMMDVLSTVEMLTERGVALRSISDGVDPSTPTGSLLLHLLLSVASYERLLTHERVNNGIRAAQARGVRFGRPAPDPVDVERRVRVARRAIAEDGLSASAAAELVGWSRSTLYRHMASIAA